jgi:hypothetical protein
MVRGIYNVQKSAEAYHREKVRLEAEDEAFRAGTPWNSENEIEAAVDHIVADLTKKMVTANRCH